MRKQRVIRRMIGGIAEPGDAIHGYEDPIRIEQAGDCKSSAAQRQSGDQNSAGSDPVDQKSDRRLQHAGHDIEDRQRQCKLGIAHVEIGAHESQQRRQYQHVVMAHHVRGADAGNQPRFSRRYRANRSELRHCGWDDLFCWRMIFSENRFPLFGIMREPSAAPARSGTASMACRYAARRARPARRAPHSSHTADRRRSPLRRSL